MASDAGSGGDGRPWKDRPAEPPSAPDTRPWFSGSPERGVAFAQASGGTWLTDLRDATSVGRVENTLRVSLQAALNRRVHVDLTTVPADLLSAKELAVSLIALARGHPEAELAAVVIENFRRHEAHVHAEVVGRREGTVIRYNPNTFGEGNRGNLIFDVLNGANRHINPIGTAAGSITVHEWGHVLDYTHDYRSGIQRDNANPEPPRQLWARGKGLRGRSLDDEVGKASGVGHVQARVARFKDHRNPRLRFKDKPFVTHQLDFEQDNKHWGVTYWKIKEQVSRYALKSRWEMVGEAYADVTLSDRPRGINRVVHQRLMRALGHGQDHRVAGLADMVSTVQAGFSENEFFGGPDILPQTRDRWRTFVADRRAADRGQSGRGQSGRGADSSGRDGPGRPRGPDSSTALSSAGTGAPRVSEPRKRPSALPEPGGGIRRRISRGLGLKRGLGKD
ncbi:hypothetical protein [Streptodolium elevatio]|uniref:Uncharacterized protein n=1 Tax=Streptodolium elevatio TaxID=3157996 RepID=A0ABV3DS96_9ACTN